jgi:hypothetical protein
MGKIRKYIKWIALPALIIIVVIAVRPMFWLGNIGLGWVLFLLIFPVGILATCVFHYINAKNLGISILAASIVMALIIGTIWGSIILYKQTPVLKDWEVKAIANDYIKTYRVTAVEYKGDRVWKLKLINISGVIYLYYDESSGALLARDPSNPPSGGNTPIQATATTPFPPTIPPLLPPNITNK